MKIAFKLSFFLLVTFLLISSVSGQERNYSIRTIAGNLSVSSNADELNCVVKLGRKVIRTFECDYSPEVLKHIKQPIAPFDQIIVFQNQIVGNMCDGVDVFLLGLNKNGSFEFSDPIDYCGGPKPLVTVGNGKITITFPAFRSARSGVFIRKKVWIYENGVIRQLKQNKKRRKR